MRVSVICLLCVCVLARATENILGWSRRLVELPEFQSAIPPLAAHKTQLASQIIITALLFEACELQTLIFGLVAL